MTASIPGRLPLSRPAAGWRHGARRRGVALMLALWLIVVLGTIATSVALASRSTTSVVSNYRARVVGRYAAESGITAAVRMLEDSLTLLADTLDRRGYLNHLERALGELDQFTMGDARAAVALVDVSARLDVNAADESSLATLFSQFTDPVRAASAAVAIRAHIVGTDVTQSTSGESLLREAERRGSPGSGLLAARPLHSLDELERIPGVPRALVERAAGHLTVDGDGTINRVTATDTVLAAARGELRDEPSRILIVSRGWIEGHPLTHEIQAVYAVTGNALTLVRWRERDL